MAPDRKEFFSAVVFSFAGILYGTITLRDLPLGSFVNMGPGFFPLVLSCLLVAIGLVAVVKAFYFNSGEDVGKIPWRGASLLLAGIAFFAVSIDYVGLAPAVFVSALLSSASTGELGWRGSLLASAVLTVASVAVFIYGIGLPVQTFGDLF